MNWHPSQIVLVPSTAALVTAGPNYPNGPPAPTQLDSGGWTVPWVTANADRKKLHPCPLEEMQVCEKYCLNKMR